MHSTIEGPTLRTAHSLGARRARISRMSRMWSLPLGIVAGLALGIVARGWMRLLTDEPEFSWSGTIFIVAAFAVAGFGHAIAWAARCSGARRCWSTVARVAAGGLTLPLFAGAGAVMLPTVVAGALARWRADWPRWVRGVMLLLAALAPVALVVEAWRDGFDARVLLGLVLFAATYTVIVASLRPVAAPLDDGWRMRRGARVALVVVGVLALLMTATFTVGIAADV